MYLPRFYVKQKLTMMVNRYEIHEAAPDGSIGLGAGYDVRPPTERRSARFARPSARGCLLRFDLQRECSRAEATGQERNQLVAILRRFVELPFTFLFDFTDQTTGAIVMTSERHMSLRDRYQVTVPDDRLDLRLAAAMAVGLDVLLTPLTPLTGRRCLSAR